MGVSMNILNFLSEGRAEQAILNYKPEVDDIAIPRNRMLHMYGVAELMYNAYESFDCKYLTREQVYILGLLHDIGYINGKEEHERVGAEMYNVDDMIRHCIEWHGVTPKEYMDIHMCYNEDIPGELILLWWADLSIESCGTNAGEPVGFKQRLESIADRYGDDSEPYRICKETIEWLCNNIALKFLTTHDKITN